jgi:hypothetical protein
MQYRRLIVEVGSINGGTHGPADSRLEALLEQYTGRAMPERVVGEFQALCEAEGEDPTTLAAESGIFFTMSVQSHNQMVEV